MSTGRLPPGQQLAAETKWPIVGERLPAPTTGPWHLTVHGLVNQPLSLSLEQLQSLQKVEQSIDIHCVTRWSKFGMLFTGVRLADVLEPCGLHAEARFLSFVAHSDRRHSTSLPLEEALKLETILALSANGEPLSSEHGGPLRVVVPGKYFYKSLKWLTEIRVLPRDELGFWEGKAGYHNEADPWREQRYVAPNLNRMQVAKAFTQRQFAGLEFQGLEARGMTLAGVDATAATLRNADFRQAQLRDSNFQSANLSNARFELSDLRNASFQGADLEGADFTGADLRGCDFRGASLLGTTFRAAPDATDSQINGMGADIDPTTRFDEHQLEQLTALQAEYIARQIV